MTTTKARNQLLDVYRAMRSARGKKLTRKQAAAEMREYKKAKATRKRAEQDELARERVAETNAQARKTVADGLRRLLAVDEMLRALATDQGFAHMDAIDSAEAARTILVHHMAAMEQALYQLGIWNGNGGSDSQPEGWFHDRPFNARVDH